MIPRRDQHADHRIGGSSHLSPARFMFLTTEDAEEHGGLGVSLSSMLRFVRNGGQSFFGLGIQVASVDPAIS
jgi:hypothetical protein